MKNKQAEGPYVMEHETLFSIFLVVLAFLWKGGSAASGAEALPLFVALLGVNLVSGQALRRWPGNAGVAAGSVLANCAVITAIVNSSGAHESRLWVLYLLPIFSACILLGRFGMVWIMGGIIGVLALFHIEGDPQLTSTLLFSLALKVGVLGFAAAATWSVALKGRRDARKGREQREELERLHSRGIAQVKNDAAGYKKEKSGAIVSSVAHDLNSPLTVILASTTLLEMNRDLPMGLRKDIERIKNSARLCASVVTHLVTRIRDEELREETSSINEVIDSVLFMLEDRFGNAGVLTERRLAGDPLWVKASRPHLQRVFMNLFSNALGVMKDGGVLRVVTALRNDDPSRGPQVEIVVEDTGPGIDPAILPCLFKAFSTTKPNGEGTGLGLFLSRDIAVRLGGTLHAESSPGRGARFVVRIPSMTTVAQEKAEIVVG